METHWTCTDVVAEQLFVISGKSWQSGKVSGDWKKRNIVPIYFKGRKEDLKAGHYRPVILSSVPGMIVEEILLEDRLHEG